jgi:hypothetical protein
MPWVVRGLVLNPDGIDAIKGASDVKPLCSEVKPAGSQLGPWYLAKAKALSVGLSNAYFKSLELPSLFEQC